MGQRFSMDRYKTRWAYTFLAFPILFYIVVRYYPTFNAFYISMTDWNIVSKEKHFIGLANFKLLFSDEVFYQTMGNTIRYTVYGLPIGLLLSFTLAYLIDRAGALESFFKAAYFVPYITSLVALSWVWRWLYQQAPIGVFNNILISLGLPQQGFLYDKDQALFAVLAPTIWAYVGFQMVIFLAGLKAIPERYYEAASIDGASRRQQLFRITLPLLRPTVVFLLIVGSIYYLRIFTQVYNMSYQGGGGPLNATKPIVLHIYNSAFRHFEMGYASALTVILFAIIMVITLIELRVTKSHD